MATVGKWGVTREPNGELAYIGRWPWYWRYPFALACLVATWAVFFLILSKLHASDNRIWIFIIGGAGATLWILSVVYELAGLLLVVAMIWGATKLIGMAVPNSWKPVSRAEFEEVRANADQALSVAQEASEAVNDGASSDSTMGTEIQEAKDAADAAQQAADEANDAAAEAQAKLDAICGNAPTLCY